MTDAPVVCDSSPLIVLEQIGHQALTQSVGPFVPQASPGLGESEAIILALETSTRLIILDDRPARRLAQALRLSVIGALGILLAAKRRGLLTTVRPYLEMLAQHDFRVSPVLYQQVLADTDES